MACVTNLDTSRSGLYSFAFRDKLHFKTHSKSFCQSFQSSERGIAGSVFESADVSLCNTGYFGKLFLRKIPIISTFDDCSHDLTLRLEGFPFFN